MLEEQSLTQNKVIVYEVHEIIKSLNSMRDLMISIKEINQQAEEYLDSVYMVEDGIEKFTLNAIAEGMYLDENHETQSTNHLEELSFCYLCNEEAMKIVGIKERFQQTKQISRFSYKE
nr:disease resistance protein [Tanacetum cinerariifolium]